MASRTKQKEEARARRLAEEQARVAQERRQRRLRLISGVVLGAIAIVAVAIAISSGGGGGASGLKTGAQSTQVQSQVQQLLTGVPQSGAVLGKSTAPVTLTYYGDLQCPICQAFTLQGGFGQLVSQDVRAGKVKVVYKGFETATRDPQTFQNQQVAALAAGQQSHFWDYVELFYRQQGAEGTGYVTENYLNGLAKQIPTLNLNAWNSARNSSTLINQVQTEQQQAGAAGVSATPTLVFQGPRGKAQVPQSVPSYDQLEQAAKSVS